MIGIILMSSLPFPVSKCKVSQWSTVWAADEVALLETPSHWNATISLAKLYKYEITMATAIRKAA